METQAFEQARKPFVPWNKGRVTGQKPPLKPREVWAIRVRLRISNCGRAVRWRNNALVLRSVCNWRVAVAHSAGL